LAFPCPSVIYATFPDDLHASYGGFFVIDGILPRNSEEGVIRQNGMPRYRHLFKAIWFIPLFLREGSSSKIKYFLFAHCSPIFRVVD